MKRKFLAVLPAMLTTIGALTLPACYGPGPYYGGPVGPPAGTVVLGEVKAVQAGRIHLVPDLLFSWLDDLPAPNRLSGYCGLGSCSILPPSRRTSAPWPAAS